MDELKNIWIYEGPVMSFGKVIQNKWTAKTKAKTAKEAIRNISFTYKTDHQMTSNTKIELDSKYLKILN